MAAAAPFAPLFQEYMKQTMPHYVPQITGFAFSVTDKIGFDLDTTGRKRKIQGRQCY